jgi:hypothetical protein
LSGSGTDSNSNNDALVMTLSQQQVTFTASTATISTSLSIPATQNGASLGTLTETLSATVPVSAFPIPYTSVVSTVSLQTALQQAVQSVLTGLPPISNLQTTYASGQALNLNPSGLTTSVCVTVPGQGTSCDTGQGAGLFFPSTPSAQAAMQQFANWILDYQCTQSATAAAATTAYGASACASAVSTLSIHIAR